MCPLLQLCIFIGGSVQRFHWTLEWYQIEVLLQAKKNSDNFEMAPSSFLLNDFLPENKRLYYEENVVVI